LRLEEIDSEFKQIRSCMEQGGSAFAKNDWTRARSAYQQALELMLKSHAKTDPAVVDCCRCIAETLYALREYAEAAQYYEFVLQSQIAGEHSESNIALHLKLAKAFEFAGRPDDANVIFAEADRLSTEHLPPNHPLTPKIIDAHARMLRKNQQDKEAAILELRLKNMRNPQSTKMILESLQPTEQEQAEQKDQEQSETGASVADLDAIQAPVDHDGQSLRALQKIDLDEQTSSGPVLPAWLRIVVVALVCSIGVGVVALCFVERQRQTELEKSNALYHKYVGKTFTSADQQKRLHFLNKQTIELQLGSQSLSPDYSFSPAPSGMTQPVAENSYMETGSGLVDADGTELYPKNAPELVTVEQGNDFASAAQEYFDQRGHYPADMTALTVFQPNLIYDNACTNKVDRPTLLCLKLSTAQELDKLKSLTDEGKQWPGEQALVPGCVHGCLVSCEQEQELFIRVADRNGKLVSSSTAHQCLVISVRNGTEPDEPLPTTVDPIERITILVKL